MLYNEQDDMPDEALQNSSAEQPDDMTPEEYEMMLLQYQNPYVSQQQNTAAQMVTTLTSMLAMFMPMMMMGSMGVILTQKAWIPTDVRTRLISSYGSKIVARVETRLKPDVGVPAAEAAAKHLWAQRSGKAIFTQVVTADERMRLVDTYGKWAVNRATTMVPASWGLPALEAAASHQWELYKGTIGINGVPTAKRPTKKKVTTEVKTEPTERKLKAEGLTPNEVELMVADIRDFHTPSGSWPTTADVREWVGEKFSKVISTPAARTLLDKAKRGPGD